MTFISGQQSNCQFGKSTLRQKVWKFTVDNLTNGPSTGHPWCADIIKPDNITPISSAPIICGHNTILSGILTQHLDIYSPHSPHCKHYETHFRESVSQSHESQRIIKSFIRQWQEFVRFKDFSVTNSSQDSHRKFCSCSWPSEPNMKASPVSPVFQLIVKHAEVCGKSSRPEHYNLYQPGSMVIQLSLWAQFSSPTQFWMLGWLWRLIFITLAKVPGPY